MTIWTPILNGNGAVETSDGLEGHVFISYGISPAGPPPDVWTPLDLTRFGVPRDAVSVDVSGLLVITMGSSPGFSNMCLAFRKPGAENVEIRKHYVFQVVGNTGDGVRSTAATIVTPVNGIIEYGWFWTGNEPGWPSGPAMAANLTFTRWIK